ncbi:E3 ubiquitin-protein ligase TRIM71-like [Glandiceps talaboti]
MADAASKFLEEINENFLLCAICTEPYRNAKLLPCLHSFCEHCLDQLFRRSCKSTIKCPLCSRNQRVPPKGVSGFSTFFFLNQLVERFSSRDQVSANVRHSGASRRTPTTVNKCGACDGESPKNHCVDCDMQLCDACSRGHKRVRSTKSHTVMSLVTYKDAKSKNPASVQPPIYCTRHPDVPLKFYCDSCELPICSECTVVDHSKPKHKVRSMSDAADDYKKYLVKMVEKMRMKEDGAIAGKIAVQQRSESLSESFANEEKKITNFVKEMTRRIKESGRKLLKELKDEYDNRKTTLQAQTKELDNAKNDLINARELAVNLMHFGNAAQLMTAQQGMAFQMHELMMIQTTCPQSNCFSFDFKPNDDMVNFKRLGVIKTITRTKGDLLVPGQQKADCQPVRPKVTPHKGLLCQFGWKEAKVGESNEYLGGISMTSKGDVLVCDSSNQRLQSFTLKGEQPGVIQFSGFSKPVAPVSVACTQEGHIFVTDGKNRQVFVCDENGKLIRYFDQGDLRGPTGIAVNSGNGKAYVIDLELRCVHIYKVDGKFIKSFGGQGCWEGQLYNPMFVCIDYKTGNVVIPDGKNHRIHVYNENGDFLFSFCSDPNIRGKYGHPMGVATDLDGNIYVCNHRGNNIMKYDNCGNFLYRIDNDQDNLRHPMGICVTDDIPCKIVASEDKTGFIKVFAQ